MCVRACRLMRPVEAACVQRLWSGRTGSVSERLRMLVGPHHRYFLDEFERAFPERIMHQRRKTSCTHTRGPLELENACSDSAVSTRCEWLILVRLRRSLAPATTGACGCAICNHFHVSIRRCSYFRRCYRWVRRVRSLGWWQSATVEALELFERLCGSNNFADSTSFVLVLNKLDRFQAKLPSSPLSALWPDYDDGCTETALKFVENKFLEKRGARHVSVHGTCALDSD